MPEQTDEGGPIKMPEHLNHGLRRGGGDGLIDEFASWILIGPNDRDWSMATHAFNGDVCPPAFGRRRQSRPVQEKHRGRPPPLGMLGIV